MEYGQGQAGRVFVIRFDDGEDILTGLTELADHEGIASATVSVLGALRRAELVCGPQEPIIPPARLKQSFADAREIVGWGTIFPADGRPAVHLHVACGRADHTFVGCLQPGSEVFLVAEAVVQELVCPAARREPLPGSELRLLRVS